MSELDMDIRAVASVTYGARVTDSDNNPVQTETQSGSAKQAAASQPVTQATDSGSASNQTNNTNGSSPVTSSAASQSKTSSQPRATVQPSFRYDSFRFIYQTDYGRIVLVNQNPETGMQIAQIPSQRALQIYAEQTRTDGQTVPATTSGAKTQPGNGTRSDQQGLGLTPSGKGSRFGHAASVSAAVPQALAVPLPALVTPTLLPVNITI